MVLPSQRSGRPRRRGDEDGLGAEHFRPASPRRRKPSLTTGLSARPRSRDRRCHRRSRIRGATVEGWAIRRRRMAGVVLWPLRIVPSRKFHHVCEPTGHGYYDGRRIPGLHVGPVRGPSADSRRYHPRRGRTVDVRGITTSNRPPPRLASARACARSGAPRRARQTPRFEVDLSIDVHDFQQPVSVGPAGETESTSEFGQPH